MNSRFRILGKENFLIILLKTMFGALFKAIGSVLLLIFITYGFIALYKKTSKIIFEKYPKLSKVKGLICGIIVLLFLIVFVLVIVFIQEIFGLSLL